MAEKKAKKADTAAQNPAATPERGKPSIAEREEAVLHMWKDREIFQKSLAATDGAEPYVFYDGPPFATGLPHYGHLLAGTLKDVMPRYQTMRGRYVRRQWGWDCHGLPIENLIEKELGFKQKREIEEYGIEKFNQKAADSVLTYDKEWKEVVPRMGRFVDMEISYKTMDPTYTESIWWAFKTLYEKKVGGERLIYEGYKSMHICPRCETTLAISEVGMNYKDTKDISVYVKFALADEPDTFLLAWTTTPWTLPGNVALAVGADVEYAKLKVNPIAQRVDETRPLQTQKEEYVYAAKKALEKFIQEDGTYIFHGVCLSDERTSIKGKDLIGRAYVPLFDAYASDEKLENRANGWKVYAADFVTTDSGTGVVHIAPAFGEDDMALGKAKKLPFVQHVAMNGTIDARVAEFAGLQAKPKDDPTATDVEVIKFLAKTGVLFAKEKIEHSYPFCWRCDTPLLNYAASSWFVNVIALKPKLLEANREVCWIPESMQEGRFGKWLEGARDWAISRSRYWGAPIPVWRCGTCGNIEAIGSLALLREKTRSTNRFFIMRHGEAENNVTGTVSYKPDDPYPLTERGRAQADEAAASLKAGGIDLIVTSPVLRTRETAERVRSALGLPESAVVVEPRIAEVNTGEFNGRPIEEYREYFTTTLEKFTRPTPGGGETLREMMIRLGEAMRDIDAKYQGKRILFVTHEYAVWLMEAVARGATDDEAAWMKVEGGDDYIANAEVRELDLAPIPHNARFELNYHRPYIDAIRWHCTCELGTMERVPDVFDCWFESGSMPFAQFHYLGEKDTPEGKAFHANFPADFIAEGLDQTRGWFYTLMVLSVGLFDRAPYRSVIVNGMILAEDGQKMSKKLKNYPDLMHIVRKYGADALRYYLLASPAVRAEDLRFSESGVEDVFKKFTLRIDNIRTFFEMYAGAGEISHAAPETSHILDRWIRSRFFETLDEVTRGLDQHEVDRAVRPIMGFIDDVSTWYIRRSRDRFKEGGEETDDARHARETTGWLLLSTAKLIAPVMPFLADDLYGRLAVKQKKESVHLELWPESGPIDAELLAGMRETREIVTKALEARAKAGIKVRQPLARLAVARGTFAEEPALVALIADEVNVHAVEPSETLAKGTVALDMELTPELREEGDVREAVRAIQELRKKAALRPGEPIIVTYRGDAPCAAFFAKHGAEIARATSASAIREGEGAAPLALDCGSASLAIAKA